MQEERIYILRTVHLTSFTSMNNNIATCKYLHALLAIHFAYNK